MVQEKTQIITEFYTKVRNLANKLQMARKPVSEEDLCFHVLTALANLLSPLLTSLHELTLYEMYSALLSHEARLEHNATQDNNFEPNVASRQGPIIS